MQKITTEKRMIEVDVPVIKNDLEDNGFNVYLGKRIIVFCVNYIYSGILKGVNSTNILLDDCGIVYETGPYNDNNFKDFQKFNHEIRISISAIESCGPTNKK